VWTPKPYAEYALLLNAKSVKATHTYNTLTFSLQESAAVLNTCKKKSFILWNMIGGNSSTVKYMPEYPWLMLQCCQNITIVNSN